MSVATRLSELGITLPAAAAPLAIYRPAVRTGHLVYVSGQIASRDGRLDGLAKAIADHDRDNPARAQQARDERQGAVRMRDVLQHVVTHDDSKRTRLEFRRHRRDVGLDAANPGFHMRCSRSGRGQFEHAL